MRRPTFAFLFFCFAVLFILIMFEDADVDEYGRSVGFISRVTEPFVSMGKSADLASTIYCYRNESSNFLEDIMNSESSVGDDAIFFHETSCATLEAGKVVLSTRQACAVESAARMNPDVQVFLLFASPVPSWNASSWTGPVQQLLKYPNVKIRHVNLDRYVSGSPLEKWYREGALWNSRWPRSHASDVLRFLTLWRFGGTYLDLDVVILRSLKSLVNYAGAENPTDVAVGVLNLRKDGIGHEIATACLEDIKQHFRGNVWGNNGPGVMTRVLTRICNVTTAREMTPEKCRGFTVHPPSMFYPVKWREWRLYFNEESSNSTMSLIKDSFAIHVWNKFSSKRNITVGSKQPYALIASKFCPRVYSHSHSVF